MSARSDARYINVVWVGYIMRPRLSGKGIQIDTATVSQFTDFTGQKIPMPSLEKGNLIAYRDHGMNQGQRARVMRFVGEERGKHVFKVDAWHINIESLRTDLFEEEESTGISRLPVNFIFDVPTAHVFNTIEQSMSTHTWDILLPGYNTLLPHMEEGDMITVRFKEAINHYEWNTSDKISLDEDGEMDADESAPENLPTVWFLKKNEIITLDQANPGDIIIRSEAKNQRKPYYFFTHHHIWEMSSKKLS